jgi:hypothetical protein
MKKIYIAYILFVLILGCETNPTNTWQQDLEFGKVIIISNIDSSAIYIDNTFTGFYTPDTLELEEGEYAITLSKDGYTSASGEVSIKSNEVKSILLELVKIGEQQIVLLENFSNMSCGPCVASNKNLKSLKNTYDKSQLLILKYATNFPSPVDPMHLAASGDSKTRMAFYNIMFTPTIYINGIDKPIASDSNSIKDKINLNLLKSAKFTIASDYSMSNDSINVNINVSVLDNSNLNFYKLKLFVAIKESKIQYPTPPGSNGETEFEDVLRKLLPGHNGYSISELKDNDEMQFKWGSEINNTWNRDKIEVIVFIQDSNTGIVYQASSSVFNSEM